MSQPERELRTSRLMNLNFSMVLSLLASVVAAGTVTLHLIGDLRHKYYLQHWGVEDGLFPKTADWILINGYYGVVDRFFSIVIAILSNLHWLAIASIILGLYIYILLKPNTGRPFKAPLWILKLPEWMQRLFRQMLLTTLFVSTVPLALLIFTAFMAVPAAFGETAGKAAAIAHASEIQKGCNQSKIPCTELKLGQETIAKGYVLDSSLSHIAIFDVDQQRARVLPLDKLELIWTYRNK